MFHQTALIVAVCTTVVLAQLPVATIPTADRKGSKDNPLLKRYEGSFIVAYERKSFGEFTLPLSPIELVRRKNGRNRTIGSTNRRTRRPSKAVYTRLAYLLPAERSPLEGACATIRTRSRARAARSSSNARGRNAAATRSAAPAAAAAT